MKKTVSIFMALAMLTMAMLSGCGAQKQTTTPAPADTAGETSAAATPGETAEAPVEIRAAWWGDTKRHELYNKIIDEFQAANKNITVVREPTSWQDYWDKLTVQSASGGAPDFMGMHPQFANDYLRRGLIEPLDSYIKDGIIDTSNMSKGAVDSGVVDGVNYMIPMGITGQSFFINKTLLTELGVEAPSFDWTWDDLKAVGLKARAAFDAAGKKNVWFIDENSGNYQLFRYWVRQNGKELYTKDGNLGFNVEDASTWFTYWNDVRQKKIVPDAATSVEYKKATLENSLFVQKKVAVRAVPVNQYKLYCQALPDAEITIVRNPSKVGGQVGEYTEGAHFAISAKTTPEKKLAAAKLINFWVNTEASMKLFGMDQGVPANTKMAEFIKPNLDQYQIKIMNYVGKIAKIAGSTIYPPAGASEVDALFQTITEQVMFNTKTPEAAAAELVEKAQAIVDKNKAK